MINWPAAKKCSWEPLATIYMLNWPAAKNGRLCIVVTRQVFQLSATGHDMQNWPAVKNGRLFIVITRPVFLLGAPSNNLHAKLVRWIEWSNVYRNHYANSFGESPWPAAINLQNQSIVEKGRRFILMIRPVFLLKVPGHNLNAKNERGAAKVSKNGHEEEGIIWLMNRL